MEIYIVVKETKKDNHIISSIILGVFLKEEDAVNRINEAYETFIKQQELDPSLDEHCYINQSHLYVKDDEVTILAKNACPKQDSFFHQTDESIYCMGYIEGYKTAQLLQRL